MQKNREPRGPVHKERNNYIWTNRKYQPIKMTKTHQPYTQEKVFRYDEILGDQKSTPEWKRWEA